MKINKITTSVELVRTLNLMNKPIKFNKCSKLNSGTRLNEQPIKIQ